MRLRRSDTTEVLVASPSTPDPDLARTRAVQSRVMSRLHAETAIYHQRADADRLSVLDRVGPQRYRLYVEVLYGFEAPLEAAFGLTPDLSSELVAQCARTPALAADLIALGLDEHGLHELPRCPTIFAFRGAAEALGWMYAVERGALLNRTLRRHLAPRIPDQIANASAYLSAAPLSLHALGDALDAVEAAGAAERVIVSAHEAFRCQRTWFAERFGASAPGRRVA